MVERSKSSSLVRSEDSPLPSTATLPSPSNFEIYKETLAPVIYRKWKASGHSGGLRNRHGKAGGLAAKGDMDYGDVEELSEFMDYLADESFPHLPPSLQTARYDPSSSSSVPTSTSSSLNFLDSLPHTFTDSLISYGLVPDEEGTKKLLSGVIDEYIKEVTKPPPIWTSTKKDECEICERKVPVTYHHLIPKSVHAKVVKRGWHEEWRLNSVAWLCRPCHSMCHKVADNETLAREFYTVERLLTREDLQRWAKYISKQRFKVKRG